MLVVGVGAFSLFNNSSEILQEQPTYSAVRGPLTIRVVESGTIKPQEQLVIINELQGQTTILSLIQEGTRVKKGDLLVELDSSKLLDDKTEQEIKVQNAEANFVGARENYAVAQSQAESDISKASLEHRFAKEDLIQYTDGLYPNQLRESESKIALAEEDLNRASEKLKWSEVLSKEKYISTTELQADQLATRRSKLELELAQNSLKLLQEYTHARKIAELESDISQSAIALERVKRKGTADVIQAEAELRAKEAEFKRQKEKLQKIEGQILKTKISAPRDGLVVYATSAKMSYRGNSEPLQEGQQVRERQELFYLPTNQGMKAEISIQETMLSMVKVGLPARIEVDASATSSYTGSVVTIAPLPDPNQMWMNPDLKVYPGQIYMDGNDESLRTGMNCKVEIIVENYEDVLQIPIQAVVRSGRRAIVYVEQLDKTFRPQAISVGYDNGSLILVQSGLNAGDKVWLTPPLEVPKEFVDQEAPMPSMAQNTVKSTPVSHVGSTQNPTPFSVAEASTMPSEDAAKKTRDSLSEEDKQKLRDRVKNMSPEEREKLRSTNKQKRPAEGGEQR
jgi:HlyD family secretion protein